MNARARRYMATGSALVIVVVLLFPVYWMVVQSLQGNSTIGGGGLIPSHLTFSAYGTAVRAQGRNLVTSLAIAFGCVVFSLAVSLPAAYGLAKLRVPFLRSGMTVLLVSQMIPGIVIANAVYSEYVSIGLLNSIPGLILADSTMAIPFCILILRAFMVAIPDELIDAARIDGAGQARTLWSVVVPVSRNSIITAGLFSFLFAWSDFIFALTLTSSNKTEPITLGIYDYLSGQIQNWAPVLATSVLSSLPAIILLIVAQRYVAAGALGGALK